MMAFSEDPNVAEQQMQAIIFYLTTFGYIDGEFQETERDFVLDYIKQLVTARVDGAGVSDSMLRLELIEKYTGHFHEVFDEIDAKVRSLFTEATAKDEPLAKFVYNKLKLLCFESFKMFDEKSQVDLMKTIDELIMADGVVSPAERKFRDELGALLDADIPIDEGEIAPVSAAQLAIEEARAAKDAAPPKAPNHPFFERVERHYSRDPKILKEQADADHILMTRCMAAWDEQREEGKGKLAGKQSFDELAGEKPFLDDHVYVYKPKAGEHLELTVLGDLHGCYSCLKGALMQADFFRKVEAWQKDPAANPNPKLVLLGDYIDRGQYSFNGILRTVMQLFLAYPEHVYVLRGNHEYYLEHNGKIYGGVRPAEAISTLEPYMPKEMFEHYMRFFESLPNMLAFDKTLFVHAGIPRDELIDSKFKDLSSLNEDEIRFQMLWSDPSEADFIPDDLQAQNARFPFGRLQFKAFMARIGLNTMVRGHEKVNEGFKKVYDDGTIYLLNLFSAGGETNDDLPPDSSYRNVTPMAMTIDWKDGKQTAKPWLIDYVTYNAPANNAFFRVPPEIEFRSE